MNATFGMKSLGIRGRLFLGFTLLMIPILIMIVLFLLRINAIESFAKNLSSVIVPTEAITSDLDAQIYEASLASHDWLITQDAADKDHFDKAWETIKRSQNQMQELIPLNTNHHFVQRWETLITLYPVLQGIQKKFLQASTTTDNAPIKKILLEEKPIINKMFDILEGKVNTSWQRQGGMFDLQVQELSQGANTILDNMVTLRIMTYVLLVISLFLAIVVSLFTAKQIINPIKAFSLHSSKIAAGNLSQRLTEDRTDELGKLGQDLNTMTDGLAEITRNIRESSQNMTSLLDEVKHASDMQSTGVSEQASSINEITASLEEIDKSATQTMEKAKALGQISEQTSQKGQLGLDAVKQSIIGMKSIHDKVQTIAKTILELSNQTQQIGEITTVVTTLALQSKMLALNASIEAAKAGEAGKGFAVVAAEVKNLAEQSEQSTTQVQKILEDIRHGTEKAVIVTEEGAKGVAEGTSVVEQMGEIMQSLTEAIYETLIASQQIEVAVRQESLGIEQITVGMNEINQVTASFVKTVQQTTELITKLGDTANRIKDYVDVYSI